jgi:hypothetical protein
MTRKLKYILLAALSIICGVIVFLQYQSQKRKHEGLLTFGHIVPIVATASTSWGVNYADYYFVTSTGKKMEGSEKCGKEFNKYIGATAIYNPAAPDEYELSFNFEQYYPTWRIVFFSLIYLPAMIFVTFGFVNLGVTLYQKFKR